MKGGKESKVERILKVIPDDHWVRASDIEEKTGINAQKIGGFISEHLLYVFVERRKTRMSGGGCYEYRCLRKMRG